MTQPTCRHCRAPLTQTLVDLGLSPLANSYVPPERADTACPRYPLHARVCNSCFLVQVEDAVPAETIFNEHYAYFSSFSESWLRHCETYVHAMIPRFALTPDSLVVEIASNDGYLLQYFVKSGIPVLGIDPTANTAAEAEKKGVPTRVEFFTRDLARQLRSEGITPDLVASANVLAHVPDINDFVAGIAEILTGDAVWTVEFPHLLNLIEQVQFDTIYHEHYTYLSLVALERILEANGLRVFDVEELPTHGGSLRVYSCRQDASHTKQIGVDNVRAKEAAANLDRIEGYEGFQPRVEALRDSFLAYLANAKAEGRTIAAYGAAAKGNTLLNYCEVGAADIAYCVDLNPAKQDTLLPGSHIPVFGTEKLEQSPPDDLVILPWNIKDEIVRQLDTLDLRFLIAVPETHVVS
ncbi:MAG: methyltransferase domain-containing protein [Arenibacterium sp.]